ncbi:hypothetical protein D3C77_542130 [compost metagenome]
MGGNEILPVDLRIGRAGSQLEKMRIGNVPLQVGVALTGARIYKELVIFINDKIGDLVVDPVRHQGIDKLLPAHGDLDKAELLG